MALILRPSCGARALIPSSAVVRSSMCCDSTARDAFSLAYKMHFLSDGKPTRDSPDLGFGPVPATESRKIVLTVLAMSFAQVSSIDQGIAEVEQRPTVC